MILGICGAGGLGREILELAKIINNTEKRWTDFIFIEIGDFPDVINGISVCTYEDAKKRYGTALEIVIALGEPAKREKLFREVKEDGVALPTLIHPDVYIPESTFIGIGVVIQQGCFISCNVKIGDYVLIQSQTNVSHDVLLDEGCILSGMANLGGNVNLGKYSYVGLSVCVKQGVSIGNYSIVGMGSVVCKDIEDEIIVVGNPAHPIRKNEEKRVFK